MTDDSNRWPAEGGDASCWAHLVDDPPLTVTPDLLGRIVRHLADAVVICNRSGTIIFWNGAAERLFGWSEDDAVGQSLDLIIPERLRDRHWTGWTHTMETGTTQYGDRLLEVPAQHRSGETLSIAFTVSLVFSDDMPGTVAGVVAVIRDQTRQWAERRALRSEVAELRGQLEGLPPQPH